MKVFNHIVEGGFRSLHSWNHFRIHGSKGNPRHLVWGKLSMYYGPVQYCEECGKENGLDAVCEECHENLFCECGQRLEDSYGSPGDGFCLRCR